MEQKRDLAWFSTPLMLRNTMRTISREEYMEAGQMFHWATKEHYMIWFTGSVARHRRTEQMLPRLVGKGKLVSEHYGKRLVYAVPRMKNTPIPHGLGVTETIVRICKCRSGGEFLPERFFKGIGSVPDWGIRYNGRLLLVEFSSQNNFEAARIIKTKMTNYTQNLPKILERCKSDEAIVLFVLNVSRERVLSFVNRNLYDDPFFFVDFEAFKSVPIGHQIVAPIYFWGDGKSGPLGGIVI